jgi:hypothetical protein
MCVNNVCASLQELHCYCVLMSSCCCNTCLACCTTVLQQTNSEHEAHIAASGSHREEYRALEATVGKLRRERESLVQDVELANMDPKAARERLLAKVKTRSQTRYP